MIRWLFLSLLPLVALAGNWGFEFGTGPAYRQDHRSWTAEVGKELCPHLRMFDWDLCFDISIGPWHLLGEGDMGWFSGQKGNLVAPFPLPGSFAFVTSGRAATANLFLGYRWGGSAAHFTPLVGWIYDTATLHHSQILPPFRRFPAEGSDLFVDASLALSNLHQRWQGGLIGFCLGWQPCASLKFLGSYAYGWLHFSQSFAEIITLQSYGAGPMPISRTQTALQGRTSGEGNGNLATFKVLFFLTRQLSLNLSSRYLGFSSNSLETPVADSTWDIEGELNSLLLAAELSYRF